ncbi:TNF receptor-associated factor 2-like [Dermacentor andersoni]|uniref:TNF receptor-associated factor 2-like n=1 Tax=Dermacentor andersoni TaxID=34620 RepID=UPI002417434D|nr:TNF receptor-associated factor 5-like [Dermacentor andersoni]
MVTFVADVPNTLLCAKCRNISSEILADPDGHLYCRPCLRMMENDGAIDCCVDKATYRMKDMETRNDTFLEALDLVAMCPKESCTYKATLREVMGHYVNCRARAVMCPLCEQKVSSKALSEHLNDTCEQRLLKCRYCSLDVEACHLKDHMDVCDQIPATCKHCKREFNTFAELRDEHLAVCPLKPMKCPYYRLGCNFQATNKEMEKHTASCKHVTSFVDRFLDLEEKLLDARAGYDELRRRTSETEKAFRELRSENEGLRKMISKNEEVIRIVQNRTMQNNPMTEKRLRELEEKHALLETPLEELLVEIAKAK